MLSADDSDRLLTRALGSNLQAATLRILAYLGGAALVLGTIVYLAA